MCFWLDVISFLFFRVLFLKICDLNLREILKIFSQIYDFIMSENIQVFSRILCKFVTLILEIIVFYLNLTPLPGSILMCMNILLFFAMPFLHRHTFQMFR